MNNPHVHIFTMVPLEETLDQAGMVLLWNGLELPTKKNSQRDTNTQPIIAWNYLRLL